MAPRNTRVSPEVEVRSPARSFARTLDNYYAPSRDRRSEQAFQEGVASFGGLLQEKADRLKATRREDEKQQGVADAMREQAGEEMHGVRTGSIFRQNSSFYMQGLNEQRGKAKGIEFRSQMAREYEAWEGKNSDDLNDFRNFMNERSGQFIESLQSNPQMLNAALPYINEIAANTATAHTAYTNERLQEEQIEASHQVFGDIVAGYSRGDYDQQTAINSLEREIEELYASGEKDARDIALDAMILEAEANDNLDPLATMAMAYDQGKVKLSKAQKARLENAVDRLEAHVIAEDNRRSKGESAEYEAMITGHVNAYTNALMENPRLDAREFYKQLGVSDEGLFRKLNTVQNAVQSAAKNSGLTDAQTELAFRSELLQAGGDTQKRNEVLLKYSNQGISAATINQELEYNVEIVNGSAIHNNATVDMLRDGYISSIAVLENNEFSMDASGAAQVYAEGQYNLQMMRALKGVDPRNSNEISRIHSEVIDNINKQILSRYPNMVTNVEAAQDPLTNKTGNAEATGMDATLEEAQDNQRIAILTDVAEEAIQTAEEEAEEAEILAQQEARTTDDPAEAQSQSDSFYEDIINSFTDGEYETGDASPTVLVETARRVFGANENAQKDLIQSFLADGGVNLDPSKTAWCAAFINSVLGQNGIDGTKSNLARSFLDWGEEVDTPQEGDIVILSRGRRDGWQGHVGIFQGFDESGNIRVLGGNQSNAVNISSYPKGRLLGYRRTPGASNTTDTLEALQNNRDPKT